MVHLVECSLNLAPLKSQGSLLILSSHNDSICLSVAGDFGRLNLNRSGLQNCVYCFDQGMTFNTSADTE